MRALDIDDDAEKEEEAELPSFEVAYPLLRLRHHHQSQGHSFHAFPLRPVVSAYSIKRPACRAFELDKAMDSALDQTDRRSYIL
jgi:hypothetical protein